MINILKAVIIAILTILFWGCPADFFETPEIEPMKLSGVVKLQGSREHSNVFIWAEDFDLKSWSDAEGKFIMELPPPANQGYGTGFNGHLTLFFFRENYLSDSIKIQFSNGYLSDGQTVVDKKGTIAEIMSLPPLYNVGFQFESGALDSEGGINYLPLGEAIDLELEISNLSGKAHELYLSFCNNIWPEVGYSNNGIYLKAWESSELPIFAVSPETFTDAIFFLPNEKRIYKTKIRVQKDQNSEAFLFQQLSAGGYILSETQFSSMDISLEPFVRARHKEISPKVLAAIDERLAFFKPDSSYFSLYPETPQLHVQILEAK
jgi:hypothetical protein